MFKRILAIVMALCLVVSFAACGGNDGTTDSGSSGGKVTTAKWEKNLSAPGDVFELPDVKSSGGKAPVIAELNKQVTPGSSFTVTGKGFSKDTKAYIYAQNEKGNGKAHEANCTVLEDTTLMITVADAIKYGVYGVYLENASGKSNLEFINRPKIWWNSFTTVNAGDEFSVYGENFTTENGDKSHAYLINEDNKYCELDIVYADPYKVTVRIPKGLEDGKQYTVKLHNGHGGEEAWAVAPEKIKFAAEKTNQFKGKKIDVTKFGANPADDKKDDSAGIKKALETAVDGDIIYFPEGVYLIDSPIQPSASVKFEGASAAKTVLVMGNNIEEAYGMFHIKFGPMEFTELGFKDVRKNSFKASFIYFRGDSYQASTYNLYIHDCNFAQDTARSQLSQIACIRVDNGNGVVVDNNKFKATKLTFINSCEKAFITNNDYCGTCYVGPYYNQNATATWNTDGMDISGNKFYGMNKLTSESTDLNAGDRTGGRSVAIQQSVRNVYIANNAMERTGCPADNAGEQIMLENLSNEYRGSITGATKDTVTLAGNAVVANDSIMTIVSGTGISQWRYISAVKGKEVTLSEPWDIVPDASSQVLITACFDNYAIHNNLFDCFTNHTKKATATCAVQLYGTTHNCFVTNNIMKNMAYGVCVTSHFKDDPKTVMTDHENGIYWTQIENNKMEKVSVGVRFILAIVSTGSGPVPMRTSFGVSVKGNEFKDIIDFEETTNKKGIGGAGILVGTTNYEYVHRPNDFTWVGDWEYGTLIENNSFINNELANILLYKHQNDTVLRNNTVDDKWELYTVAPGGKEPVIMK